MEAVGERTRSVYVSSGLSRNLRRTGAYFAGLTLPMVALSILDLSPVTTATPPAAALNNTLDLARFADTLGFTRYWLAEHHNLPTIASSAPDIMIGQVAAITKNMRIGSGRVILPNHAPLLVLARLHVLAAALPRRLDP